MRFQVEVRSRSSRARRFIARYHIEAKTEQSALASAIRWFRESNPTKDSTNFAFGVVQPELDMSPLAAAFAATSSDREVVPAQRRSRHVRGI